MTMSSQFTEIYRLSNITSINNVASILENGLICKNMILRESMQFSDISNAYVQNRRNNIYVGNNRYLHDYANLYINPRNAMLYSLIHKDMLDKICILTFSKTVLDIDDIVITNQNAAVSIGTRFMTAQEALKPGSLDYNTIKSSSWYTSDPLESDKIKKTMMAEVLVPGKIPPEYIKCIYVANEEVYKALKNMNINISIYVDPYLFFQ